MQLISISEQLVRKTLQNAIAMQLMQFSAILGVMELQHERHNRLLDICVKTDANDLSRHTDH